MDNKRDEEPVPFDSEVVMYAPKDRAIAIEEILFILNKHNLTNIDCFGILEACKWRVSRIMDEEVSDDE